MTANGLMRRQHGEAPHGSELGGSPHDVMGPGRGIATLPPELIC